MTSIDCRAFINHTSCEIKEFDLNSNEVIINCYGVRIITIKAPISQIVGDVTIILNLPSDQSCWLGYYFGRFYAQSWNAAHDFHTRGGNFLLKFRKGRFKIFSLDRNNYLTYTDVKTNESFKESPLEIAQNHLLINQFDSSQACYIGILAGLMTIKQLNSPCKTTKSFLRVIK